MERGRQAGLFREEVLQEQARRLEGSVVFAQPLVAQVAVPVLVVLTVAVGVFLVLAQYARTERVAGYLAPSAGVSTIMAPRPGVVSRLGVAVGDRVHAGDLLLEIGSESTLASGAGLESSVRESLLVQRSELETAVRAAQELFAQQQREGHESLEGVRRQLEQMGAQQGVAAERAAIAEDRQERFARLLEKGFASRDQYVSKRDEALGLQQQARDLEMARLKLTRELAQAEAAIVTAPREQEEKQANLRLRLLELEMRLREVESRSSYAIKAPVDGKVAALQVSLGSSVAPDVPIAVIMPRGGHPGSSAAGAHAGCRNDRDRPVGRRAVRSVTRRSSGSAMDASPASRPLFSPRPSSRRR